MVPDSTSTAYSADVCHRSLFVIAYWMTNDRVITTTPPVPNCPPIHREIIM
jgi:hypothetical protein